MQTISACILSYNRPEFLVEAIESILRQTVKPTEILIFDNGSDAEVHDKVQQFLNQGVRWIGSNINQGVHWNFQRAVKSATCEFLFVLHDDDRLTPKYIEEQLAYLSANPEVGAITCNGNLIDVKGKKIGKTLRSYAETNTEVELYRNGAQVAIQYASDSCLPFSPMFYRTELVRSVQIREEFGKVVDAVFFCDLAQKVPIAYNTAPLYECRTHAKQDSSEFPKEVLSKLSNFFASITGNAEDEEQLKKMLMQQYTTHQLRRVFQAIYKWDTKQLHMELKLMRHPRFSNLTALNVLCCKVVKRSDAILGWGKNMLKQHKT